MFKSFIFYAYIQGELKKVSHKFLPKSLPKLTDLQIFVLLHILWTICNKMIINYVTTP